MTDRATWIQILLLYSIRNLDLDSSPIDALRHLTRDLCLVLEAAKCVGRGEARLIPGKVIRKLCYNKEQIGPGELDPLLYLCTTIVVVCLEWIYKRLSHGKGGLAQLFAPLNAARRRAITLHVVTLTQIKLRNVNRTRA